ncbi:MAG: CoA transferase [Gammaproteobacteria bacterium]|nr:CoA transferase [Gammaproteobacteria bacterium]
MNHAPLSGIRVLDMSRVLAGPWAGQVLADLGAEVIKIERPVCGDDTRHWGPPYLRDLNNCDTDTAAYFMSANRGKSSITVDIGTAGGQSVIRDLVKVSDVLIENFKVGGLNKYRLDYAGLKDLNPRLIYCSITGFGQTGPQRHRAGYDLMIQGMGGMMSITGAKDGPPQRAGVAVADLSAGLYATIAIQGALLERERSGHGQHIDISLLDVQTAMLAHQAASYLVGGVVPGRLGSAHPNISPYQVFETADGHIILAVGNDNQFRQFAQTAGIPELAEDERFLTNASRVRNRDALCDYIADVMKTRTSQDWLDQLEAVAVPAGEINNISEVFDLPQVILRNMRAKITHPTAGEISLVGNPMKFGRTPHQADQPPPALGEHTVTILQDVLGYADAKIDALKRDGAI